MRRPAARRQRSPRSAPRDRSPAFAWRGQRGYAGWVSCVVWFVASGLEHDWRIQWKGVSEGCPARNRGERLRQVFGEEPRRNSNPDPTANGWIFDAPEEVIHDLAHEQGKIDVDHRR